IVFSERCTLKKVPEDTPSVIICRRPKMLGHLRKDLKERQVIYAPEEIERLGAILQGLTEVTEEQKQAHVDEILMRQTSNICPFCGKELVQRRGKSGPFLGCSGYPKCKYIRQNG
ncbi:MAG: topoisomerase DNA-binding C4 zinc finger domain-containing protein, partial [Oscillospiraceae bacterium]|nr:topoisomerase DNA-binding C4 zinc finger domain-containing protein [Oscillospiraceae bacterium]